MSNRAFLSGPSFIRQLQGVVSHASRQASSQSAPVVNYSDPDEVPRKTRIDLDLAEVHEILKLEDSILIDVRAPQEVAASGAIPGSINIPLKQIKNALEMSEDFWAMHYQSPKPSKRNNKHLVFYARGPNASSTAVEIAHRLGFKDSKHYTGGWSDYCRKMGIPLERKEPN